MEQSERKRGRGREGEREGERERERLSGVYKTAHYEFSDLINVSVKKLKK